MKRIGLRPLVLIFALGLLFGLCGAASATDYVIPGNLPPGLIDIESNAVVASHCTLARGDTLTIRDRHTLTVIAENASLTIEGSLTLEGRSKFFSNGGTVVNNGRIHGTRGAQIRIMTMSNFCAEFINNGSMTGDGLEMWCASANMTNNGTMDFGVDGYLGNVRAVNTFINNGTLINRGYILNSDGAVFINASGGLFDNTQGLFVNEAPSTLRNDGDFRNLGGELTGNGSFAGRVVRLSLDPKGGKFPAKSTTKFWVPMDGAYASIYTRALPVPSLKSKDFVDWAVEGMLADGGVLHLSANATAVAQWRSAAPPAYGKSAPLVLGENLFSKPKGLWPKGVKPTARLTGASFKGGAKLELTCQIGTLKKTVSVKANGVVALSFTKAQLNKLNEGRYDILISSPGNATNQPIPATSVGTVGVGDFEVLPEKWSIPATATITNGFSRQLVTPGARATGLTFSLSNPAVLSVGADGVARALSTGSCAVTATDGEGFTLTCQVSVVANRYQNATPRKLKPKGVYVSTKALWYEGDKLMAELYVYNLSGKPILSELAPVLLVFDRNQKLVELEVPAQTRATPLPNNAFDTLSFQIDDAALPGTLDLASGRIQLGLAGTTDTGNPLTSLIAGNAKAKSLIALTR